MLKSLFAAGLFLLTSITWAGPAKADDPATPPAVPQADAPAIKATDPADPAQPAATSDEIAELIKQLDDDKFAVRRQASQQLRDLGRPAVEAIAEATGSPSLEVKSRAFDLLEGFFEEGDDATKQAAQAALEKLAEGKGDVAARAKAILTPMDDVAETQPLPGQGGIQINPGGRIQIQPGGRIQIGGQIQIGGNGMKLKIANNNGNKEIEVEENGRQVKINEDAAGKIKMEVTEKKGDKEETKKYEAENAEALKKNEPEAYKIYDQYSKQNNIQFNGGAIQIFQGGQIQRGAMPVPLPQGVPIPAIPNIQLQPGIIPLPQFAPNQQGNNLPPQLQQQRIEMAKTMKEAMERMRAIQQQQQGNAAPPALDRQIEMLEKQIEKLEADLNIVDPLPEEAPAEEGPAEEAPAEEAPAE